MSLLSVDDWNEFLFNVGENFYDLVHDTGGDNLTPIQYPLIVEYDGACRVIMVSGSSYNDKLQTATCHFKLDAYSGEVLTDFVLDDDFSNYTGYYLNDFFNVNAQYISYSLSISCLNSFVSNSNSYMPYYIQSDNYIVKKFADNSINMTPFKTDMEFLWYTDKWHNDVGSKSNSVIHGLRYSYDVVSRSLDTNGYKYYYNHAPKAIMNSSWSPTLDIPSVLSSSPYLVNTTNIDSSNTVINDVKNNYINNGDTITNYTYNIDTNNYITVNYSVDSNDVPTGYIDIQPTGNISFDDLFDMFNTILAPLVGVGLDLPDWNDYLPPVVTGDVNVNIDLPNVTGVYPAETITPIDSDVYNIMSIDSMPQLPSLTGIDNGQAGVALGSSFTFLDGCGLLMPFVTLAIVRLLISKFRGDS